MIRIVLLMMMVAGAAASYGNLVGTWEVRYSTENGKGTYKISDDGKVTVLNCNWKCPDMNGVLSTSDKDEFPSAEGWYKVDKIHRPDVELYVRWKRCSLEAVYFSNWRKKGEHSISGKRLSGANSAMVGTWEVKYPTENGKATYKITDDGKVSVLNCNWKCPDASGVLSTSDKDEFPTAEGWYKVDKIHREDVSIYLRVNDCCTLEEVYFSNWRKKGEHAVGTLL